MSAERDSIDFDSVVPQTYSSKAEAFARCLHDKLMSLGGVAGFGGSEKESCACSVLVDSDGPRGDDESPNDMVNYEVPYRVLRESSSTGNLEKHFSNNLYVTKRISKSGDSLTERLTDETDGRQREEEKTVPAVRVSAVDELDTDPQVKLRRCSSLKSWKTPPGTPGEKKMVRFADALGLDLADVRTFLDEIPRIPNSAFESLNLSDFVAPPPPPLTLIPKFVQPDTRGDFLERIQRECVSLERALLTDIAVLTVSGSIRVRNIAYEKEVHVRYTNDGWTTFSDLQASYITNSCDGFSDRFSFVLYGHTLKIGGRLEFAIRLDCCGLQYWDNNSGNNYVFECLPQSPSTSQFTDIPPAESDAWAAFY